MARTPETSEHSSQSFLAQLITEDSLYDTFITRKTGLPHIQACLDALQGEQGEDLTQRMLAQYAMSENAGHATGVQPKLDERLAQFCMENNAPMNLTSDGLRSELISRLQSFIDTPEDDQSTIIAYLNDAYSRTDTRY